MADQLRLFEGKNLSRQFEPVDVAASGARSYTGGKWSDEGLGDVQVDHQRGFAQYKAYEAGAKQAPSDELLKSYASMREHVNRQYDHMTRPAEAGGMGVTHEVTAEDPYPNPHAMREDLATNRRLRTLATSSTGPHDFFSNEENDRFRAVHDMFGHAAIGRGFSRHGEEAAFMSHRQMFPPEAHRALASETRGQNSYLNYGPGGFHDRNGPVDLPDWAHKDELPPVQESPVSTQQFKQRRLF
jgi:hypothetical protein